MSSPSSGARPTRIGLRKPFHAKASGSGRLFGPYGLATAPAASVDVIDTDDAVVHLEVNKVSPTIGQTAGELKFNANNSVDTLKQYSGIESTIKTTTSGSEDGKISFYNMVSGTLTLIVEITNALIVDGAIQAKDATGIGLKDDGGNVGVWVADGGKVGIGTAYPYSYELEVNGSVNASGYIYASYFQGSGAYLSNIDADMLGGYYYYDFVTDYDLYYLESDIDTLEYEVDSLEYDIYDLEYDIYDLESEIEYMVTASSDFDYGYLVFGDGNKEVTCSNGLYWDSSGHYLGIDCDSPSYYIEVNYSAYCDGDYWNDSSSRERKMWIADYPTTGSILRRFMHGDTTYEKRVFGACDLLSIPELNPRTYMYRTHSEDILTTDGRLISRDRAKLEVANQIKTFVQPVTRTRSGEFTWAELPPDLTGGRTPADFDWYTTRPMRLSDITSETVTTWHDEPTGKWGEGFIAEEFAKYGLSDGNGIAASRICAVLWKQNQEQQRRLDALLPQTLTQRVAALEEALAAAPGATAELREENADYLERLKDSELETLTVLAQQQALEIEPWVEIPFSEAWEEVDEVKQVELPKRVTKYRINWETNQVEPYETEELVVELIPTGAMVKQLKADVRFDEDTGKCHRKRTEADLAGDPGVQAILDSYALPEYLTGRGQ